MKTDSELQKKVKAALNWIPSLQSSKIVIGVRSGVVTLTGIVDTFGEKIEAENAVKNVMGVKDVVVKMEVPTHVTSPESHSKLFKQIMSVLDNNWSIPRSSIEVKLENGKVTLTGVVPYLYQKFSAQAFLGYIKGVKSITNDIIVQSKLHDTVEQRDVEQALARNWSIRSKDIMVKVDGATVRLSGIVSSLYQKQEAGYIASKAPGITLVDNRLIVHFNYKKIA